MIKRIFIIGFPKSATTSIWSGLYRDPNVSMAIGEPSPTLHDIDIRLSELDDASGVIGFKSAVLIYRMEHLADVIQKYPEAYYIVSVRDPIGWLASFYDYRKSEMERYVQTGDGWLKPLISLSKVSDLLQNEDFNQFAMNDDGFFDVYRAKGQFKYYIEEFEKISTSDMKILYVSLEQLKVGPIDTTRKIYDFLDMELSSQRQEEFIRKSNVGSRKSIGEINQETISELKEYYTSTYEFLTSRGLL